MESNKSKWVYLTVIVVLILLLLIQHSCQGNGDTKVTTTIKDVKLTIPEVNGSFKEPINSTELPSKGRDSIVINDKIIYVESKINQDLKQKLASVENKYEVLLDAVRERDYVNNFSDKYVDITTNSKIEGKLQNINLVYKLKSRDTIVQEKTILKEKIISSRFALYSGANVISNSSTGKLSPGIDIAAQVNSSTIITAGINTDKDILVGIKFRLFNVNK